MILARPSTLTLLAAATAMTLGPAASGQLALLDFEDGMTGPFFGADTFGSGSRAGQAKPILSVMDDSLGLGSGNALFVESGGTGAELTAFLDTPLAIGPNVGDGLAVEFDWRLIIPEGTPPEFGNGLAGGVDFRFGFYNDGGNSIGQQFGTVNVDTGETEIDPVTMEEVPIIENIPAIFGETGGEFDGSSGPIAADFGVHSRVFFNSDISNFRIRDEAEGDTDGIMSGSGNTIVTGNTVREGGASYAEIGSGEANTFRFELLRGERDIVDEVTMEVIGTEETIVGRFIVTNSAGVTVIDNDDPFTQMTQTVFDYLVFEDNGGDFDYVIDNFRVFELPDTIVGDYNGDGFVSQPDLDLVLLELGRQCPARRLRRRSSRWRRPVRQPDQPERTRRRPAELGRWHTARSGRRDPRARERRFVGLSRPRHSFTASQSLNLSVPPRVPGSTPGTHAS